MFPLQCPVRGCQNALSASSDQLSCDSGHHFDRSKYGYWSLVQPQDRKSLNPGDSDSAVLARQRWLSKGHMAGLETKLRDWIDELPLPNASNALQLLTAVDLGCGEGTFGRALFSRDIPKTVTYDWDFCGIDLSKRAVRIAARGWPEATWLFANADRRLPILNDSIDLVLSLFGRRPIQESKRILRHGGHCLVAVPGPDDLIELRQLAQQEGQARSRWEKIVNGFSADGFEVVAREQWKSVVELDLETTRDAMAMTYRAVRESQQKRLQKSLDSKFETDSHLAVTLSADLMLFRAT